MASAGGSDGRPPPQRPPLRLVRIPLPRLPAGQRVMLRFVSGQAAGRGNPGVRPHIHIVGVQSNPTHPPHPPQPRDRINSAVRQQEEELQRRAEEEHRRREQLKARLTPSEPPQVAYCAEEGTAELSWQPVGPTPSAEDWQPEYYVLMSEGDSDPLQVYRGHMTSCTVSCDLVFPGHTYNFTVAATADEERGEPSPGRSLVVPALPPSPPLPPRVASRAKTSLTLRWSAPSKDNGSAITLYSLEWDQCGRDYVELYSGKGKQFKFNNRFPPGSQALFRLRAQNEVGWSTYSNPLEFSAGAGPPSTPHPPTLTQAGVHHLTLEWTAPVDNGSPITAFCLEMEDPDSGYGFCPVYQGEEPYCTCSSLQRATGYNFRLSATNDRGTSSSSHPITHRTLPDVPGQPPGPTLKDRSHCTVLNIAWRAPEDDGGSEICSYLLQLDDGRGSPLATAYQGPATGYLAEGLSPGRPYQCRVCACSEGGQGAWSSLSQFQTPPTLPHAPRALRLWSRPTQTSVTLEWDRPESDGGAAITSYCLEVRPASGGTWQAIGTVADPHFFLDQGLAPLSPPPLVHTLEHLLPGEDYELQVTCQNSVGASSPSALLPCTMAPGPADAPADLEVSNRTASSAQLRWQPSLEHGCPATSYMLELTSAGAERQVVSTDSLSSHTLRALHPATSYTIRLKALSKAGPSEWTPPTLFTTTPSTPAQPLHFSMVSCTHTSLLVGWAVPECNGALVTGYYIEVNAVSGHMASQKIPVHAMETQQLLENLQSSTTYRLRVQAENEMGKGPFSPYIMASTLHPPPPPPTLALVSCTTQSLKVAWGRKQHKGTEYLLQMAQQGRGFRTVYRGSATTHKATRLQTATEYTCRAAAISESGQGAWSEHVTFETLPSPPLAPTELVLRQVSEQELLLSWAAVDYPLPLSYDVQVRTAKPGQDFEQAYKGVACSCSLIVRSHDLSHEARVRGVASCDINGREELLWGTFAHPVYCLCKKLEEEIVGGAQEEPSPSPSLPAEGVADGWGLDRKLLGLSALVFVSLLVFALAFLIGQYVLQQ